MNANVYDRAVYARRTRQSQPLRLALLLLLAGFVALALPPRSALAEEESGHGPGEQAVEAGTHAAGSAHGAAHHPAALDNWFSLSFGPDKEHRNGPLGFAILNFVVLAWLVVRFSRRPFRQYLVNRHSTIQRALFEAADMREQARKKLAEIESKLSAIEQETASIKAAVLKDAELERDRMIKAAQAEAERIIAQADKTLEKELRRAHRMLEVEAVESALKASEKIIQQALTDADRSRLNEVYYSELGAGPSGPGGSN